MAKYKIYRSDSAQNDLKEIALYIAIHNATDVALRIVNLFETAILRLEDMPHCGSPAKFTYKKNHNYRFLVVENYLVHYHTDDDTHIVYIDRIRHGAISPKHQLP